METEDLKEEDHECCGNCHNHEEQNDDDFVEISRQELNELRDKNTFLEERHIRDLAENENFRKRVNEEKIRTIDFITGDVLAAIIPTLDNFERALALKNVSDEVVNFLKGFEMIKTGLEMQLKDLGLNEISSLNEIFDSSKHHAVSTINDSNLDDDIVTEEIQKGYTYKNKIVRPAMVVVNKKEDSQNE